jgi:hypothetical protein
MLAVPAGLAQVGGPVRPGDLALGLSRATLTETAQLARGGQLIGGWEQTQFLQSMEFDNVNGLSHNARGNLLALNFGATLTGGALHSLATNGADAAQMLWAFDGIQGNLTRASGLSVDPENTRVAAQGYDDLSLYILEYQAGNGDGTGGAVTGVIEGAFAFMPGGTQGTTWLDHDTVLLYTYDFNFEINETQLWRADIVGGNVNYSLMTDNITVIGAGSQFADVEYNPLVAPWVICFYSSFGAQSENTLTFISPQSGAVLRQISLSQSLNTGREIALGPDGKLYLGAYGGSTAVGPIIDTLDLDANGDGTIDAADLPLIADNSSVDYYQAVGISSSFNGLDVSVEGGAPCDPCDTNCDGSVDAFDIEPFISLLVGGGQGCSPCAADVDGNGFVDAFDIEPFINCLVGP